MPSIIKMSCNFLRRVFATGISEAPPQTDELADTVFALNQQAMTSYVMEPAISREALLTHLRAQNALLVGPYLTEPASSSV